MSPPIVTFSGYECCLPRAIVWEGDSVVTFNFMRRKELHAEKSLLAENVHSIKSSFWLSDCIELCICGSGTSVTTLTLNDSNTLLWQCRGKSWSLWRRVKIPVSTTTATTKKNESGIDSLKWLRFEHSCNSFTWPPEALDEIHHSQIYRLFPTCSVISHSYFLQLGRIYDNLTHS